MTTFDSITLSWSVDEHVISSEVKWQEIGSDGSDERSNMTANNTFTIERLKNNTEYNITVTVYNRAGYNESQLIVLTTEKGKTYKYTITYM